MTDPIIFTPTWTFFLVLIWELTWKGLALYRSGKKQQPWWFFFLLILNTAGILPIVYLFITRDKKIKTQKILSKKKK